MVGETGGPLLEIQGADNGIGYVIRINGPEPQDVGWLDACSRLTEPRLYIAVNHKVGAYRFPVYSAAEAAVKLMRGTDPRWRNDKDRRSTIIDGAAPEDASEYVLKIDRMEIGAWSPQAADAPDWKPAEVHVRSYLADGVSAETRAVIAASGAPLVVRFKTATALRDHIEALIRSYGTVWGAATFPAAVPMNRKNPT